MEICSHTSTLSSNLGVASPHEPRTRLGSFLFRRSPSAGLLQFSQCSSLQTRMIYIFSSLMWSDIETSSA